MTTTREQRAARHQCIFFRFVALDLIGMLIYTFAGLEGEAVSTGRHTATVTLEGEITTNTDTSAENVNTSLQAVFIDDSTVGVIPEINSSDSSPVQADMISGEICHLHVKYRKIPPYVIVEEMYVSGDYYVATVADEICIDKVGIVGSIGVLIDGFNFTGLIDKVGVERRLLAAGSNEGMSDPFSPMSPQQK